MNAQSPNPVSEWSSRAINGAVVVAVIIVTAYVLVQIAGFCDAAGKLVGLLGDPNTREIARTTLHELMTGASPLFGSFTTLVGTAIAAYFGISATREASHEASTSATTLATHSTQLAGDLRDHIDTLKQQNVAQADKLGQVKDILNATDPNKPDHASALDQARTLLA